MTPKQRQVVTILAIACGTVVLLFCECLLFVAYVNTINPTP